MNFHCVCALMALGKASWDGGALVTLGDCRCLFGPVIVGSLRGFGACC